jgi:carbonic anhydrase
MSTYSQYEFRNYPGFDQNTFEDFNWAIPMKTLAIYCFDPRAADIPEALAKHFGDEVYPGENILDDAGNRVGHTRTLFTLTNGGGRASTALQSIAAMEYLFKMQNLIVVHHSFCGTTAFTPELFIEEFRDHHHVDVSTMFDRDSLAILDYEKSIKYDVELLRSSPLVPKEIKIYGFFYDISTGKLTEIVRDIPA